jgi:hypothetical protein
MLSAQTENAILALAITKPTWGPLQLALELRLTEHGSWLVAPSTIYRLLLGSPKRTGRESADRADAVPVVRCSATAGTACGGLSSGGVGLSGHLLYRQAQGRMGGRGKGVARMDYRQLVFREGNGRQVRVLKANSQGGSHERDV